MPDTVNKAVNNNKKKVHASRRLFLLSESNDKEIYNTIINRDKHYPETSNYTELILGQKPLLGNLWKNDSLPRESGSET